MTIRQLVGDCRVQLASLDAGSVQTCITSPPYYGLRDYGTPPLAWGGDAGCAHDWHHVDEFHNRGDDTAGPKQKSNNGAVTGRGVVRYGTCACGAWLGSLGLEPTPELYLEHLVEVFREVRRVLRADGTLWVNLGDSYAGSGKGPTGWNGIGNHDSRQGFVGTSQRSHDESGVPGVKPKDLMMMPSRVATALQADGWWLRSMIPWLKRNSMPESVTDRPATSVEYVFLLSKSRTYFWDADAVRRDSQPWATKKPDGWDTALGGHNTIHRNGREKGVNTGDERTGRNWRNSDLFFESWQGLMLDELDDPLALVVNPMPFKGSHFATFPPKLVEPMVKAGTSEKGQCPECGAPWMRETSVTYDNPGNRTTNGPRSTANRDITAGFARRLERRSDTVGWRASCAHSEASPVPQVVLDPFGGAGTVGLVADRLGRAAILVDLKPDYADMATGRIVGDAPMFVEMTGGGHGHVA